MFLKCFISVHVNTITPHLLLNIKTSRGYIHNSTEEYKCRCTVLIYNRIDRMLMA